MENSEVDTQLEEAESVDNVSERAEEFLSGLLARMNVRADISVTEEDDRIVLDIECENVEFIIGRRGQVIDALQHLVIKAASPTRVVPRGERSKSIVVDAGGYRSKHIERLESLACRMGAKAVEQQTTVELNPMSAYDRRIVHMALANFEGVTTHSTGDGDRRRVQVIPAVGGVAAASTE